MPARLLTRHVPAWFGEHEPFLRMEIERDVRRLFGKAAAESILPQVANAPIERLVAVWNRIPYADSFLGVDPAPSDGSDTQTTVLREIITDSEGVWIRCAAEGAVCAFSGTRQVRYGAQEIYATKTITDGTPCDNTVFGDPVPNVEKACDYLNESPE